MNELPVCPSDANAGRQPVWFDRLEAVVWGFGILGAALLYSADWLSQGFDGREFASLNQLSGLPAREIVAAWLGATGLILGVVSLLAMHLWGPIALFRDFRALGRFLQRWRTRKKTPSQLP